MITLKGSRFLVSCENYKSKVFINNGREYKEVTNELSEDDKTELIDDLIYAIIDLMNDNEMDNVNILNNKNIEPVLLKHLVARYKMDKMLLDKHPEHKVLLEKRIKQHEKDIVNYVTGTSFQPKLNLLTL